MTKKQRYKQSFYLKIFTNEKGMGHDKTNGSAPTLKR
jgi:hypothetical protein